MRIAGQGGRHVTADAAFEADPSRRFIADDLGARAQIRPNPTRAGRPPLDRALHRERRRAERLLIRIGRFRRIARRREGAVTSSGAFAALACAMARLNEAA